jgi:hypothetical protein
VALEFVDTVYQRVSSVFNPSVRILYCRMNFMRSSLMLTRGARGQLVRGAVRVWCSELGISVKGVVGMQRRGRLRLSYTCPPMERNPHNYYAQRNATNTPRHTLDGLLCPNSMFLIPPLITPSQQPPSSSPLAVVSTSLSP